MQLVGHIKVNDLTFLLLEKRAQLSMKNHILFVNDTSYFHIELNYSLIKRVYIFFLMMELRMTSRYSRQVQKI